MALEHSEYGRNGNDLLSDFRHAQDEFTLQLIDAVAPPILQGVCSIVDEAERLCKEKGEPEKYLKTFQNMLARIPGWNTALISREVDRITEAAQIGYLPDLVTAVHIIHLRILSSVRVGHKPKRIEIDPPDFDQFIHRVYCETGRKMWTYAYLFRRDVSDLDHQQNMHECEKIVRECVLMAVRLSLPVETILRAYIDEAEEIRLSALEEAKMAQESEEEPEEENVKNSKKGGDGKRATTDVESEVKRIKAIGLPELVLADANDNDEDDDDDDDMYDITDNIKPTTKANEPRSLSVGFAEKNEVFDMGTNRRNEIKMQPIPPSPIRPAGPPLKAVTTNDLLSTRAPPLAVSTALTLTPRPIAPLRPSRAVNGGGCLEDITSSIGRDNSTILSTLHLDTSHF